MGKEKTKRNQLQRMERRKLNYQKRRC